MSEPTTHVLLGAGGAISSSLSRCLLEQQQPVRLVSRSGHALPGAETVRADLLDAASVREAIPQGATVYLLAGLPYRIGVWAEQWPRIMSNVLEACAARQARLIFFDNVYMYGRVTGPMTEDTPINPTSRKGEVRARIAGALVDAAQAGRVQACIARSADFYGPGAERTSAPGLLVFAALAAGKRPQWLIDPDVPHSLTFTSDCGPALAALAGSDDAWGQVWHVPTAAPALTGREFVRLAAQALGGSPRVRVLRPWMLRLAGLMDPTIRELHEMQYQNAEPYQFDSSKIEQRFGLRPTGYAEGIAETAQRYLRTGA